MKASVPAGPEYHARSTPPPVRLAGPRVHVHFSAYCALVLFAADTRFVVIQAATTVIHDSDATEVSSNPRTPKQQVDHDEDHFFGAGDGQDDTRLRYDDL